MTTRITKFSTIYQANKYLEKHPDNIRVEIKIVMEPDRPTATIYVIEKDNTDYDGI